MSTFFNVMSSQIGAQKDLVSLGGEESKEGDADQISSVASPVLALFQELGADDKLVNYFQTKRIGQVNKEYKLTQNRQKDLAAKISAKIGSIVSTNKGYNP